MTKRIAVVEKFAGKIKIKTILTGTHNCNKLSLNLISFSLFLAKYLATKTIKTKPAKVDV